MINAIAIDDEPPALELLQYYCDKIDYITLNRTFTAPSEALKYIRKYPVDLIFLDIQMPGISGTEFCKKIEQERMVVFTTAYSNYAVEGFDLDVVDFLLKPYSFERFEQAAEKIKHYHQFLMRKPAPGNAYIFLRADYSLVKIPLHDLLYVEGLEDYSKFYFGQEAPMVIRITLKALLEKLPEDQFLRVHRSYIIRIDKTEKVRSNTLFINGKEIHIGRVYKPHVMGILNSNTGKLPE
jgi:DNA-binding LytR/AlgR family response regulator